MLAVRQGNSYVAHPATPYLRYHRSYKPHRYCPSYDNYCGRHGSARGGQFGLGRANLGQRNDPPTTDMDSTTAISDATTTFDDPVANLFTQEFREPSPSSLITSTSTQLIASSSTIDIASANLTESLHGLNPFDPENFQIVREEDVDMEGANDKGKGMEKETNFD